MAAARNSTNRLLPFDATDDDAGDALLTVLLAGDLGMLTRQLLRVVVWIGIVMIVEQQVNLAGVGEDTDGDAFLSAHLGARLVARALAALGHVTGHVHDLALNRDVFLGVGNAGQAHPEETHH